MEYAGLGPTDRRGAGYGVETQRSRRWTSKRTPPKKKGRVKLASWAQPKNVGASWGGAAWQGGSPSEGVGSGPPAHGAHPPNAEAKVDAPRGGTPPRGGMRTQQP